MKVLSQSKIYDRSAVDTAVVMLMSGFVPKEISSQTGLAKPYISILRALLQIPPFKRGRKLLINNPRTTRIKYLRNKKITLSKIGLQMGVSKQAIHQIINRTKYNAKHSARYHTKVGHIKPAILCQICGIKKPLTKHHSDYSNPTSVIWLCKTCHTIADNLKNKNESRTSQNP